MATKPVIFVVGYGPGISEGVAELFASKGFKVGIASRTESKLSAASESLNAKGATVATAVIDVSSNPSVIYGLSKLTIALGAPNVLVFNVGSNGPPGTDLGPKPLEEITPEIFEKHWRISALGALHVARWSVDHLVPFDGKKTLIFTGGGLAKDPRPNHAGLAAAKAAMRNLSRVYYNVHKPNGLHVGLVTVRGFVTPESDKWSPKLIAEQYWKLYEEKDPESWTWEIDY
ncbi:NADP-binding protein [Dacryopinax primogenitus]|uniref:NADP-binding protein n=1 Tax=Dacryopinax primogenitus (strain DJM 731) TaxID=1858805 RepID=M5G7R9_DACPD|nr:NADP-binding protein [Dacryopinax primogenitus]EJU06246.1 NADP-binding protein [Dacryopinax primogenitus]